MSETNQTKWTHGCRQWLPEAKGISCMGKDGNQISGGEHTVVYTEVKIQCTHEPNTMWKTNFTSI